MPDRALTCSRIVPSTMPSKPAWFPRLPEILDVIVYSMDTSYLDRQAVEHLGTVTLTGIHSSSMRNQFWPARTISDLAVMSISGTYRKSVNLTVPSHGRLARRGPVARRSITPRIRARSTVLHGAFSRLLNERRSR